MTDDELEEKLRKAREVVDLYSDGMRGIARKIGEIAERIAGKAETPDESVSPGDLAVLRALGEIADVLEQSLKKIEKAAYE